MSCNQHLHVGDQLKYPRVAKWIGRIIFIFGVTVALAVMVKASNQPEEFISSAAAVEEVKAMTLEDSIEKIKMRTVHKLASECETKGSKNPNSEIIFDSNHVASVGRFQYQLKTVQHWVKVLYKKDITRDEALLIAMGQGSIDVEELTKKVLFEIKDGQNEWFNCANKLGLKKEIEIINQLGK